MASTVLQAIKPTINELGQDHTDVEVQQQFEGWAVDAVSSIVNETPDWPFVIGSQTVSTAAGTANYALGTLVSDVRSIVSPNDVELRLTSETEIARAGFDLTQSGQPSAYMFASWSATNGPTIKLWPVPTAAENYTVYRITDPAALTLSNTLELPNGLFHALRLHIKAAFFRSVGDLETSDRYQRDYNIEIMKAKKRYATRDGARYRFKPRDIPSPSGSTASPQFPATYPRV